MNGVSRTAEFNEGKQTGKVIQLLTADETLDEQHVQKR